MPGPVQEKKEQAKLEITPAGTEEKVTSVPEKLQVSQQVEVVLPTPPAEKLNRITEEESKSLADLLQTAFNDFGKDLSLYVNAEDLPKWNIDPKEVFTLNMLLQELEGFAIKDAITRAKDQIKRRLKLTDKISYENADELV